MPKKDYGPNPDIPADVKRELHAAIKIQARGKSLQMEAEAMIKSAKETILPILAVYGDSYHLDRVGRVNKRINRGSAINAQKLREQMLLAEIPPKTINRVVEASTNRWESEYVEFKPDAS